MSLSSHGTSKDPSRRIGSDQFGRVVPIDSAGLPFRSLHLTPFPPIIVISTLLHILLQKYYETTPDWVATFSSKRCPHPLQTMDRYDEPNLEVGFLSDANHLF